MNRAPVVLFVFGQGGHATAMIRLRQHLNLQGVREIQIVETLAAQIPGVKSYVVPRIMPKGRANFWSIFSVSLNILINVLVVAFVFFRYQVRIVVSTGPLVAVVPSLLGHCSGVETIFLESWCRFESFSRTGRILYKMGATIYYQNFEIATQMARAKYAGRL